MDLFKDISPRSGGGEVPSQVRGAPFGGGDAARLGVRRATPMGHAGYPPRHADAEHAAYRTFRGGGSAIPPQLWIDLLATVDNGDNFVHNPVDLWTGFLSEAGARMFPWLAEARRRRWLWSLTWVNPSVMLCVSRRRSSFPQGDIRMPARSVPRHATNT